MKAHHYEPFSGRVNALARTAVRTEPSAFEKPTAAVTSEGAAEKRRHNWLRSILEVSRLTVGSLMLPLESGAGRSQERRRASDYCETVNKPTRHSS